MLVLFFGEYSSQEAGANKYNFLNIPPEEGGLNKGKEVVVSCCHWKQARKLLCLILHWLWFLTWSTQIVSSTGASWLKSKKSAFQGTSALCWKESCQCENIGDPELPLCVCKCVWERTLLQISLCLFLGFPFPYCPQPCSIICYIWVGISESHSQVWAVKQVLLDGILENPMRRRRFMNIFHISMDRWDCWIIYKAELIKDVTIPLTIPDL